MVFLNSEEYFNGKESEKSRMAITDHSNYQEKLTLESEAWANYHFRKTHRLLLKQTTHVLSLEERGRYLRKCLKLDLIPAKELNIMISSQTFGYMKHSFLDKEYTIDDVVKALRENVKKLREDKGQFEALIQAALKGVLPKYHQTLLCSVSKKGSSISQQIKNKYIQSVKTLIRSDREKSVYGGSCETSPNSSLNSSNSGISYTRRSFVGMDARSYIEEAMCGNWRERNE